MADFIDLTVSNNGRQQFDRIARSAPFEINIKNGVAIEAPLTVWKPTLKQTGSGNTASAYILNMNNIDTKTRSTPARSTAENPDQCSSFMDSELLNHILENLLCPDNQQEFTVSSVPNLRPGKNLVYYYGMKRYGEQFIRHLILEELLAKQEYEFLWREQNVGGKRLALDYSRKAFKGMNVNGSKMWNR